MACYNWHGQVHITMHYVVHHMQCIVMFGSTEKNTHEALLSQKKLHMIMPTWQKKRSSTSGFRSLFFNLQHPPQRS